MPALIRGTIFFSMSGPGARSAGWSETHYLPTAADLDSALPDMVLLAGQRSLLLGAGVTVKYIRVSDDNVFRDVRSVGGLNPFPSAGHGVYYNPFFDQLAADFSQQCVNIRINGNGPTYWRSLYLSGAPDIFQGIENPVPNNPNWNIAFNQWRARMLNGKYGFKVQDGTLPRIPVINLNASIFTSNAVHNLAPNDLVRIRGFLPSPPPNNFPSPNGLWQVSTVPSATTFTLLNYSQLLFLPRRMGSVRKISYILTPYTNLFPAGFATHKRGRPFGQSVGRRRRRAS